jgi:hypothetical protein
MTKYKKDVYASLHVEVHKKFKDRLDSLASFDGRKLKWLVEELIRLGLEHYREKYPCLISNSSLDPALKNDRDQS